MSTLAPILNSTAMSECTKQTRFVIPNIAPYSTGYDRVSDKICLSEACGAAIRAIQARKLDECELTAAASTPLLAGVTAKLFAQHLDPVFDLCGDDPSQYGPTVTPDLSAMDPSQACTQFGIASHFWGRQNEIEQCAGASLMSLVSNLSGGANAVDVVEAFAVCSTCDTIHNATFSLPLCVLPGRVESFRTHIEYAFSFCESLRTLQQSGDITGVLRETLLNSTTACPFNVRSMQAAMKIADNGIFETENCTALLYGPTEPLSDADRDSLCSTCTNAKAAISGIVVPTCLTAFGERYDTFLRNALSNCTTGDNTSSSGSSATSDLSSSQAVASASDVVVPPTPTSAAVKMSALSGRTVAMIVGGTVTLVGTAL